jgi:hypothetical protein
MDLKDCEENIDAPCSIEEHKARKRLVRTCAQILMSLGVDIGEDDLKSALVEVDSYQ